MQLLFFSVLVASSYASAAYLVPDPSILFRQCVGPACPIFSLPMPMEKPGVHHSMNCSKGDVIPHPSECQSFYVCRQKGKGIKLTCTVGYAYHPRIKQCVPESLVKSCGKVYCPPSVVVGTVPDKNNCTRYYRCVYGMPMHYQCDSGFVFDEELGKCMEYSDDDVPTCISGESETTTTGSSITTTTTTGVPEISTEEIITEEPISIPAPSDNPLMLKH